MLRNIFSPSVQFTVKLTPLLVIPLAVTTTLPVVAPAGTVTSTVVALQLVGVAAVLWKVTVLTPSMSPKFLPASVTASPTAPAFGDRLTMFGVTSIVLFGLLGSCPFGSWFCSQINVVGNRTCQVSITVTSVGRCCIALISSATDR